MTGALGVNHGGYRTAWTSYLAPADASPPAVKPVGAYPRGPERERLLVTCHACKRVHLGPPAFQGWCGACLDEGKDEGRVRLRDRARWGRK